MLPGVPWLNAFIDESGQHDLDLEKEGPSNLFVCVAVIVNDEQFTQADTDMRIVSQKYFSEGEVQSKNIGSDHGRRSRILESITNIVFGYCALVVDKSRIEQDSGLRHKRSFYKFLNRMLYNRLLMSSRSLHIVADEIGGPDFMASFVPYLRQKGKPDLFTDWDHQFANSTATPLVQLADLVAGTLTYCFDPDKRGPHSDGFRQQLKAKEYGIAGWPLIPAGIEEGPREIDGDLDRSLYHACLRKVQRFEREHEGSMDLNRRMQVATLRRLLFLKEFEQEGIERSITAESLILHLENLNFPGLSRQTFASNIIGPIRDTGIIIAGGHEGYSLATTVVGIQRYVEHDRTILHPMLARLQRAREVTRLDTGGQHDILSEQENRVLRAIIEAFGEPII